MTSCTRTHPTTLPNPLNWKLSPNSLNWKLTPNPLNWRLHYPFLWIRNYISLVFWLNLTSSESLPTTLTLTLPKPLNPSPDLLSQFTWVGLLQPCRVPSWNHSRNPQHCFVVNICLWKKEFIIECSNWKWATFWSFLSSGKLMKEFPLLFNILVNSGIWLVSGWRILEENQFTVEPVNSFFLGLKCICQKVVQTSHHIPNESSFWFR